MPLATGARLGPFEVLGPLGAGGMGEVYRARDSRLGRDVALKVLPQAFATDPDRRARFEREARVVASLAHPHICVVHDVGREDGADYIVMELLEGETLARRLERGPLAIEQALGYAVQIVSALDGAHRHGVTHRDLKPANIMLTKSGIKLLDFGLAKLRDRDGSPYASAVATTIESTTKGTILGTVQYMAPEQLEGGEADARTDIFAFGAILFEMVTGDKAFTGNTSVSIMSAILKETPRPASALRPTPPPLDRLIATCLEKNPDDRWQTARDLLRELRWISTLSATSSQPVTSRSNRRLTSLAVLVGAVGVLIGVVATRWLASPSIDSPQVHRGAVPLAQRRIAGEVPPLALSHDGTRLIYAGVQPDTAASQLFLHSLSTGETRPIADTDGASSAFFAPDDERVAFFAANKLWMTSLRGTPPTALCEAPLGIGATWAPDDTIYFTPSVSSGLWKVSASGGACEEVTMPSGTGFSHRLPHMLPGGKALIYTERGGNGNDAVKVLTLATGESHEIAMAGTTARYVPSGHVVYARGGTLLAAPFDLVSLKVTGPAIAVQEQVGNGFEAAQFDVSDSGALVYVRGDPQSARRRLVWVDRRGAIQPVSGPPGAYVNPRLSPDGRYATVNLDNNTSRTAIYDLATGFVQELSALAGYAIWTPKDSRVIFTRALSALVRKRAFGSEDPEVLVPNVRGVPGSITPDEAWLVYHGVDATGDIDIWSVSLNGGRKPEQFISTPGRDIGPRLSRTGELLAYATQSATTQLFVTSFPSKRENVRVSVDGGYEPVWSQAGSELFYRWRNKMMSVRIRTQPGLGVDSPKELFNGTFETGRAGLAGYDVAADGRFLMVESTADEEIHIVWNWVSGLKERLTAKP